jgi:hypothetical protein
MPAILGIQEAESRCMGGSVVEFSLATQEAEIRRINI